ncbi:hypothetical protein FRC08_013595, partial [Ceratobasidium sp. 394]
TFTMHSALTCPDIIASILANLDQPDLARALRVCRQWNEWSDVLWKSLPTLSPLLRLTFPFVFTGNNEKYIQSVPLHQVDKTRFAQLAGSVRRIDASHTPSGTFFHDCNPNIPDLLLDTCKFGSSLFPRLQHLRTQCRNDAEIFGVLPLLSSSLQSLEISIHHSAIDFMLELFGGIEKNATRLERLDITCQPRSVKRSHSDDPGQRESDSYVYIPPIGPVLSALSSTLHTLSIPSSCMSIDTFLALARLPLLQSLIFSDPWCPEAHGDEWPDLDPHSFPSLTHLSLPCSVPAATHFLTALPDSTPISHIEINSPSSHPGQDLSGWSTALSRFRLSLRSVALKLPQTAPSDSTLKWSVAFNPLLACGKIKQLTLELAVDISDADAEGIASCFGTIESFRVPACLLSLAGLRSFTNIKDLRELEITTSAFEGPDTVLGSLASTTSGSSDGILHLNVGASVTQSPALAAHSIRALFPRRKIVDLAWTSGQCDVHWEVVRHLLRH